MIEFRQAYNMTEETKYQNWNHIHPLMQLEVFKLIEFLKPYGLIKLIIFGSTVQKDRCHVWSDLDIYVEGCGMDVVDKYEPLRIITLDVITPEWAGKDSPIKREIERSGVCVYG